MAVFLLVPVLLMANGKMTELMVEAWFPDYVWQCTAIHNKQSLYFTCEGVDGNPIKFSVGGLNKA
jgi:hypothetical protein